MRSTVSIHSGVSTYLMFRLPKFRSRARSRGQGVVELAIVLPILILLLLVTLDFGRLFMSYITLTNTTRVAANYGATNPGNFTGTPNTTTYDAIVNGESAGLNCVLHGSGGFNPPLPTFPTGTGLSGKSVAEMDCDFTLLTPFMTAFFGGPLTISAKSEFPIRTGAIANIGGSTTLPPPGSPLAAFNFINVGGGSDRRLRQRVGCRSVRRQRQQHVGEPRPGSGTGVTAARSETDPLRPRTPLPRQLDREADRQEPDRHLDRDAHREP